MWMYTCTHTCSHRNTCTQVHMYTHARTKSHHHHKTTHPSLLLQQNLFLIRHQCPNYKISGCHILLWPFCSLHPCSAPFLCLLTGSAWLAAHTTAFGTSWMSCRAACTNFPPFTYVGTGSHTPGITWLENRQQNLPIMLFIWSIRVMLTSAWGSFSWVLALNLLYENDQWLLGKYQNLSVPTCETMPANVGFVCLRSQLFGELSQFTKVIFIPAWGASLKAAQCSKRNPQSQCVLRLFYLRVSWKKIPAFSWWFPSLFILLCLFHVLSTVYLFSTAYILQ